MNLGRFGRVGRMIVGRAGRLVIALALAGVLLTAALMPTAAPTAPAAMADSGATKALVCQMKPTRIGWRCFCRGAYGWRTAPKIMC